MKHQQTNIDILNTAILESTYLLTAFLWGNSPQKLISGNRKITILKNQKYLVQ